MLVTLSLASLSSLIDLVAMSLADQCPACLSFFVLSMAALSSLLVLVALSLAALSSLLVLVALSLAALASVHAVCLSLLHCL